MWSPVTFDWGVIEHQLTNNLVFFLDITIRFVVNLQNQRHMKHATNNAKKKSAEGGVSIHESQKQKQNTPLFVDMWTEAFLL